jgi:hypothetical protein
VKLIAWLHVPSAHSRFPHLARGFDFMSTPATFFAFSPTIPTLYVAGIITQWRQRFAIAHDKRQSPAPKRPQMQVMGANSEARFLAGSATHTTKV